MAISTIGQEGLSSSAQYIGFKNRIINGDMRIDQRNAGAAVTPGGSSYSSVDRFQQLMTQGSKFSVQQLSTTPPTGFTHYLRATTISSYTPLSGDYFLIAQRIEGFNIADFGLGTSSASPFTISFWVRSSLTGVFGGAVRSSAGTYVSCPFQYTINSANTWEYKTVTIPSSGAIGTFYTNNGVGLNVYFSLGINAADKNVAGTWYVGSPNGYLAPTGSVNMIENLNATLDITGIQLEKGSVATAFDYRPYGTELQLCQRYYHANELHTLAANTGNGDATMYFPVPMRVVPSYTYNDMQGNVGKYSDSAGHNLTYNIDASSPYTWGFRFQTALSRTAAWVEIKYKWSAEL